jgi:hypothetical protein
MGGYYMCDVCGSIYHNVMMKKLCTPEGKYITDVPEMIDICPDCFEKFCNWIKMVKEETK